MEKRGGRFNQILEDIKDVKIQGATNVAKASIKAYILANKQKQINLKKATKQILATRPTEPLMQNAIKFLQKSKHPESSAKKYLDYIKLSKTKIAKKGATLIKNNMNIFTHCHSSTVMGILKLAKKRKKKFVIYTTEVEPLLQGRLTARELANTGIKVIISPDLAAEHTLKNCDLLLFGADAFSKNSLANKIGTSTLCRIAEHYRIPRYACTISLKYTKKIKLESRPSREVWDERKKKINVINPAFDLVPKNLLSGIISELGILSYNQFIKKAKQNLKKFS